MLLLLLHLLLLDLVGLGDVGFVLIPFDGRGYVESHCPKLLQVPLSNLGELFASPRSRDSPFESLRPNHLWDDVGL